MIDLNDVGTAARPALAGMIVAAVALTGALTGAAAQAQDDYSSYPERPIALIIPFAPGAGNDILGRQIALRLSEVLGQPVVPENQAGAGGTRGVAARSEEHTSELQSLMRISYAVFCLKKKKYTNNKTDQTSRRETESETLHW